MVALEGGEGGNFKRDETREATLNMKRMNRRVILFFTAFLSATFCALSCHSQESVPVKKEPEDLSKKVVQTTLNQSEPAEVKVGLEGITTLEFPAKIEAINGYGFSMQPNSDTDEFQLTYEKGTNFLSLKALRPGVSANLTVVLNEKVYCFYCEQDSDPSFVVIFAAPGENSRFVAKGEPQPVVADKKALNHEQVLSFLAKVKGYSTLKTGSPDAIASLRVAEPEKSGAIGEIETVIKRVVCDESLGLVGFEVQLGNRSQSDFYFDPDGFSVRVDDATYDACISDAGGIVPARTSVPAFFVVVGTTPGGANQLSVDRNFDLQLRPADAPTNGSVAANFTLPPTDHIPTAGIASKEGAKKVGNAGKGGLAKGNKEAKKKTKQGSAQVNAEEHATKTQEPDPKKHWFDLFKRNSVTAD
jgi:hypothetical protein